MKRFLLLVISLILVFPCFFVNSLKSASAYEISYNSVINYQNKVLTEFSKITNRLAGSENEKQASDYIKAELDKISQENPRFSAVNNSSTKEGVQKFTFSSRLSGKNERSQNLIYNYKSSEETNKRIIIACSYDSIALQQNIDDLTINFVDSQAVSGSSASVALVLSLAKNLIAMNLPFDVEIIFFGASESGFAGSKFYTQGLLPADKENILCMINVDNIAIGKNLYFYVDEVSNGFEKFVSNALNEDNLNTKQVDVVHLGKFLYDYENELGLNYGHVAMNSDNINFMKENILSLNFFAGDYDDGIVYGTTEYCGEESIIYTKNDNLEYINEKFGEDYLRNNLYNAYASLVSIVLGEGFEDACLSAKNSTKLFYGIFGNQKLIAYFMVVALIIMIAIAIYFHFKLSIKSYNANVESEFLNTVLKISQHVDGTMSNEAVPKVVSQVVANDIKKDKTIKTKRKKNKDQ